VANDIVQVEKKNERVEEKNQKIESSALTREYWWKV